MHRRGRFHTWEFVRRILRNMAGLTIAILTVYFGSLAFGAEVASARAAAFATWLLGHIILALNLKQELEPAHHSCLSSCSVWRCFCSYGNA